MHFDLTDEQEFFVDTTRRFLTNEMPTSTVRELASTADGFDRAWWKRGAELGWTSMLVSEEHGGGSVSGSASRDLALISEQIGRFVAPGPLLPTNLVALALSRDGTAEQRSSVLPELLSGETIAAWCWREPGAGWEAAAVGCVALRDDHGGWTLSGTKTTVEAGAQADVLLISARVADGLTQFLVPADRSGVTIEPLESLDIGRRFAEIRFDGVVMTQADVVGNVGGADDTVAEMLRHAAVVLSAQMSGAAAQVFEFTCAYAFDRSSFGRPLASYQALKHRFADMKLWVEACHATTSGAAEALSTADGVEASILTSVAKAYVGDHAAEIIQDCVQIHGGIGVTWEHDLHLYLRRATLDRGLFGPPDTHRRHIASMVSEDAA